MPQDNFVYGKQPWMSGFGADSPPYTPPPSGAADVHEFFDWGDLGMGIIGAPVEMASDLYGFADALAFDSLPDWEASDLIGERTSTMGDITQEMIPWLFTFSKVSKFLGAGAKIGKTRYLKGLSETSQKVLARRGNIKGAAALRIGRANMAAGLTTATLYERQEGSLTEALQRIPYLGDLVPDFLDTDPDDGEAVLRLKAGLEDALFGGMIETAVVVFRGMRGVRAAQRKNPDMTPEEIDELAERLIDQDELGAALERDGIVPASKVDDVVEETGERTAGDVPESAIPRGLIDDAEEAVARADSQVDEFMPDNAQEILDIAERRNPGDWAHGEGRGEILNPRERLEDGSYRYSTSELYRRLTLRKGLNVQNTLLSTANPQDMVNLIRALDLKHSKMIKGRELVTEEQLSSAMQKMKDFYNVDDAGLIQKLNPSLTGRFGAGMSDADILRELGQSAMAHEMTMAPLFDQFTRLMKKAEKTGSLGDMMDAMKAVVKLSTASSGVRDFRGEWGRQGRFMQTPLGGLQPSQLKKILAEQGLDTKAIQRQLDRVSAALKQNPHLSDFEKMAGVAKMLRGKKFRWGDVVTEGWVNAILSAPATHVANIIGNSMTLALRPVELAAGSLVNLNSRGMRAAFEQIKFITSDTLDALSLGLSVERNEFLRPIGNTKWQAIGRNRSIGQHTLSQDFIDKHPGGAALVERVGKMVNISGTLLENMDNFFKQINFRSRIKMRLFDKGMTELGMQGAEAAEYVVKEMDRIVDNGQIIASEEFFKRGLAMGLKHFKGDKAKALPFAKRYARKQYKENRAFVDEAMGFAEENTFTKKHSKERGTLSGIAAGLQSFTADFWPARFYIPFVGTPTNLLLYAADRMNPMEMAKMVAEPINFRRSTPALNEIRSRVVKELRSGDVIIQREAVGRVMLGNALVVTAWNLAMQGKITGRGPANLQERKLLERSETGWQPYSFLIGGKAYSFHRLDPLATMLGTVADVVAALSQTGTDDTSKLEAVASGLWAAAQNNFTEKSYMKGLKAMMEMGGADSEQALKAMRPIFGGFVPNILPRTLGVPAMPLTGDDTMREVGGLLEYALARVPYFSKTLPPQRNVLGEVVKRKGTMSKRPGLSIIESMFLPIQYTETNDESVLGEFASLKGTAFYPPQVRPGGIDYREFENAEGQDAYDRFMELHGVVTVEGMHLKQALKKLFKTEAYLRASPETLPGVPSPRAEMIKKYINIFRRAARNRLLREFPEIREAQREMRIKSRKQLVSEALNN